MGTMTDINPAAKAALEDHRENSGRFGVQGHSSPEVDLPVSRLAALTQTWQDAREAEVKAKDAAQCVAAQELRLLAPYNATEILFTVEAAYHPFERAHIKSAGFVNPSENEFDDVDEHEVNELVSFLDVEWVGDNADEVFHDGTALLSVGPETEAVRLKTLLTALEYLPAGSDEHQQLLNDITDIADYVTRGRTANADFAGIVAEDRGDEGPVPVGFVRWDGLVERFDDDKLSHAAAAEHLRYAVRKTGWHPGPTEGQYFRRV